LAKLTAAQARAELARRKQAQKLDWDPQSILYEDQLAVFNDTTRDRALEGTRQLGKTTLAAVELIRAAVENPGSESAYVDLDIEHAEKVIARDFESLVEKYKIPGNPQVVAGDLYFENGSVVYSFSGRPSEIEKLQGLKFAILIVDEAQDGSDLEGIIKMCRPALIRHRGRVLFTGIPGRVRGIGFWWDITNGDKAHLYGQHRGHMRRNPYLPTDSLMEQFEAAKAELGEANPDFIRHWLGQWPESDNAARVYRWDPIVQTFDAIPECEYYTSGTDPAGIRDREASIVLGIKGEMIYPVYESVSAKGAGGEYWDTAEVLKECARRFKPLRSFYDFGSASKSMLVTTITKDFSHYLEAVPPKHLDFEIPRVNSLFIKGRLVINRKLTPNLAADLAGVHWDLKERAAGRNKYDKRTPHPDVADALRAALWGAPGYAVAPKEKKPLPTEEDAIQAHIDEMYKKSAQGLYVQKQSGINALLGARQPLRRQIAVQRKY
jgi:hypothetical protein